MKFAIALLAVTTIGTITAINITPACGTVGNPCKRLAEGEPACERLGGEWNEKRNCCNISKN